MLVVGEQLNTRRDVLILFENGLAWRGTNHSNILGEWVAILFRASLEEMVVVRQRVVFLRTRLFFYLLRIQIQRAFLFDIAKSLLSVVKSFFCNDRLEFGVQEELVRAASNECLRRSIATSDV